MRLTNALRPALVAIALLAALSIASTRSNAQVHLTLDNPFQTVIRPDIGITEYVDFTGTLSVDKGYTISDFTVEFPANASNTFQLFSYFGGVNSLDANDGNSVSGVLFKTYSDWIIDLDYYGYSPGTLNPALLSVSVINDLGDTATVNVPFSLTVVAVPEPGNVALLAGTVLSGGGLLIRRMKSRKQA